MTGENLVASGAFGLNINSNDFRACCECCTGAFFFLSTFDFFCATGATAGGATSPFLYASFLAFAAAFFAAFFAALSALGPYSKIKNWVRQTQK